MKKRRPLRPPPREKEEYVLGEPIESTLLSVLPTGIEVDGEGLTLTQLHHTPFVAGAAVDRQNIGSLTGSGVNRSGTGRMEIDREVFECISRSPEVISVDERVIATGTSQNSVTIRLRTLEIESK